MPYPTGTYANRTTARTIGTVTIAGVDIKGIFRDITHSRTVNMIECRAVNDPGVWAKAGTKGGSLEVECANEGATIMAANLGTAVAFTHSILGTVTTGSAIISAQTEASGSIDGAPTERFTLTEIVLS